MAEIVNDLTIQIFKDVLLNGLRSDSSDMKRTASDYDVDEDTYVQAYPQMLTAALSIRKASFVLCKEVMEEIDKEIYASMVDQGIETITLSQEEYDKVIDSLGIEKAASIIGDSVKFYDWYRNSSDDSLNIIKDRNDVSEDVVTDDDNPFFKED